jgi:UPF0716 protein FxsA
MVATHAFAPDRGRLKPGRALYIGKNGPETSLSGTKIGAEKAKEMRLGPLLLGGFLVVPLIEIGLFIVIGQTIGLWPTLLGVLLTAIIGSAIIRVQGISLIADIQRQMNAGKLPARQMVDGVLLAVAGALLITPGYFTDTCGFLLLVPPIRTLLYNWLKTQITVVDPMAGTMSGQDPFGPAPGEREGPGAGRRPGRGTIDLDSDEWR